MQHAVDNFNVDEDYFIFVITNTLNFDGIPGDVSL